MSEKNHIIFILFGSAGFLSDSQAGLLALCVIGNFPNACNKNSVSLIQLSAFSQSVLSLCLSNVRVDIFYLLKSINLLLWRERHISGEACCTLLSNAAVCPLCSMAEQQMELTVSMPSSHHFQSRLPKKHPEELCVLLFSARITHASRNFIVFFS